MCHAGERYEKIRPLNDILCSRRASLSLAVHLLVEGRKVHGHGSAR